MRLKVLLMAFLMLAATLPAVAATTPKAGATCTREGQTSISGGKKFTCIKKVRKLVWNSGIPLTVTKPAPLATPTPSATPTPTPIKEPTFLERWESTGSQAITAFNQVFAEVPSKYSKVQLIWRISDNVEPALKAEMLRRYEYSADFWTRYASFPRPIQVILGGLNDLSFLCYWRNQHLNMQHTGCESSLKPRLDSGRALAGTTQDNGANTDWYLLGSTTLDRLAFYSSIPHEFFHNVQEGSASRYKFTFPCWLEEGGAEYFGVVISSEKNAENFIKLRSWTLTKIQGPTGDNSTSVEKWKSWISRTALNSSIENSDAWGCESVVSQGVYEYGIFIYEYLMQQIGIPGILELYRKTNLVGWPQAVQTVMGRSTDQLYTQIAEYADREFRIFMENRWSAYINRD